MPATITCTSCQAQFPLKPEYAGRRLKCGKCGQALDVPAESTAGNDPLTIACGSCGARFAAKPEYAGRRLKCSKCKGEICVPAGKPANSATTEAARAKPTSNNSKPAPAVAAKKSTSSIASSLGDLPPLAEDDFWPTVPSPAAAQTEAATTPRAQGTPPPANTADGFWDDISVGGTPATAPVERTPAVIETRMPAPVSTKKSQAAAMPALMQGGAILLGGFIAAPIIYFVAQCFVSPLIALVLAALAMNFMAVVGSFAIACVFFGQKIPAFDEIIRIVGFGSSVPMVAIMMLLLCGWVSKDLLLAAGGLILPGIAFAAWRCMDNLKMAAPQAILVSVTSNLGALTLTAAGYFMLGAIFLHGSGLDNLTLDSGDETEMEAVESEDQPEGQSERQPHGPSQAQVEAKERADAAIEDNNLTELLASDPVRRKEARAWFSSRAGNLENIRWEGDRAMLVKFVNDLYTAGAKEVLVYCGDPEVNTLMTRLVVILPETAVARQKVFETHYRFWKRVSPAEDSETSADETPPSYLGKDVGQKYLQEYFE